MVQAAAQGERMLDERAARRAAAGDEAAFAELYRRHFDGVHDFVARMAKDRELAGEVVQASFVRAWESLRSGKEVTRVKPWLYAIARNATIDELHRRSRERPAGSGSEEDEPNPFVRPDPARLADPETAAADRELAELVWGAAAGLNPGDYALLDMHLRRDLDADEIAEALGLRKGTVYTRLSRMKDALEESMGSLLLIRRGRRDCPELDALLTELGGEELDTDSRRAVTRHARRCERCRARRRSFASPVEVLGALTPVPALPGVQEAVWAAVSSSDQGAASPGGSDLGDGGIGRWQSTRTATMAKVLAAAATGAALIGALLLLGAGRVADPADVHSMSHRVGVPTARSQIEMAWSPPEGASGYSVEWSRSPDVLPDQAPDLPGEADSVTTELGPGRWYFALRTQGEEGEWTATVRSGPYLIEANESRRGRGSHGGRGNRGDESGGAGPRGGENASPGPGPGSPPPGRSGPPDAPPGEPESAPSTEPEAPLPAEPELPTQDPQQGPQQQQPQIQPPVQGPPVVPP